MTQQISLGRLLVMLTKRCSVFETKSMVVLEADCITHAQKQ
ncbi:hypothetical protein NIES4073_27300 [Kalymmatonema gypsitolerans NIES-4073]|nr:hypothetical protein NIES4073_27300 [Scytonema sp. NIES-4073]